MKLKHIALIGSLFPILFSLVLFFGVLISADSDDENSNFSSGITGMNLSAEVLKHQPMVEKYAREYGISRANLSMIFPLIAVSREFSIKIPARLPDKISQLCRFMFFGRP